MTKQTIKQLLFLILTLDVWLTTYAQSDTTFIQVPNNSCQPYFDSNKISIHYSYSSSNQTHNYSNNWDFDADGKTDELYFMGTGGAHLYFYLRIVLSSDKKVRDFPFLNIDMPCLGNITELKNAKFYPTPAFPQFVVDKFQTDKLGVNSNDKIYLHLDSFASLPSELIKKGVTSHYLLLQYDNGEMSIKNFIQ